MNKKLLTALNMAVRVRRVVMAIPVLPGMDSGGRKRESQETITKSPGKYGDVRGVEGLETRKFVKENWHSVYYCLNLKFINFYLLCLQRRERV